MASILMDVLKPEIDERVSNEVNNDRRTNLYIYVQDGAMNLDYAAKQANLSTADFSSAMASAGYKVPQNAS